MAVPRVFISSTYYDLKEVRNNIGNFVLNLGYEPIMHERSSVAYMHDKPLEEDCYHELISCDIVVCIIGSKFGSQSSINELSITMNEIQNAINHRKKVYIFIAKEMYIENRTYEQNKGNSGFRSAYTDDLRVHEFICELRNNVKVHVISSFETTDEIINTLKTQFAGLFQNLLSRDASVTDVKVIDDLNQSTELLKKIILEMNDINDSFFRKFDSTVLGNNYTVRRIEKCLNLHNAAIFARDINALDEIMGVCGFQSRDIDNEFEDMRKYVNERCFPMVYELILRRGLFNDDGTFKDIRISKVLDENIIWTEKDTSDDLPF